jgi:hypothetical protein
MATRRAKTPTYEANRTQFVFIETCGCPLGLVEGSYAKTEDGAWDTFCDTRADERRLRARGVTVDHVPHAEYTERYFPLMLTGCTHTSAAGA